MSAGWATGLLAEIYVEVLVDFQTALCGITVDLQEVGARFAKIGVELIVPNAIERISDVEPFAIEAELEHLGSALQIMPLDATCLPKQTATPDLTTQVRVCGIADI